MTDVIRTSKEIDVIRAWMQTQWERIPATPHSQPGSYARGYDGGMVDILRGLQATLDKLPPAHETSERQEMVVLRPCAIHQGMTFFATVGYRPPLREVCPGCEKWPPEVTSEKANAGLVEIGRHLDNINPGIERKPDDPL